MPLNITPAGSQQTAQPAAPAKYAPTRTSPSMTGNTAPIDGVEPGKPAPQVARQPPPAQARQPVPEQVDGEQPAAEGADGEGGEQPGQPDPDTAWRLAIVARKDAEARKRIDAAKAAEARLKAAEDALAKREEAIKAEEARRATWRQNPAALLRDHGFVPEAALQFMLNGEKLTPEQQLAAQLDQRLEASQRQQQEEIRRLREEQATAAEQARQEEEKRQQAQLTEQQQAAVEELQAEIGQLVEQDGKAYPLLRKAGARGISTVFARLEEHSNQQLEQTGKRPLITTKLLERMAQQVEADARKELQETYTDPEIAAALGLPAQRPSATVPARPRTLTNQIPAAAPARQPERPETDAERRERVKAQLDVMFRRRQQGG